MFCQSSNTVEFSTCWLFSTFSSRIPRRGTSAAPSRMLFACSLLRVRQGQAMPVMLKRQCQTKKLSSHTDDKTIRQVRSEYSGLTPVSFGMEDKCSKDWRGLEIFGLLKQPWSIWLGSLEAHVDSSVNQKPTRTWFRQPWKPSVVETTSNWELAGLCLTAFQTENQNFEMMAGFSLPKQSLVVLLP